MYKTSLLFVGLLAAIATAAVIEPDSYEINGL